MSYIIYPCVDAMDSDANWQIGRKEAEKKSRKKKIAAKEAAKKEKEEREAKQAKQAKGGHGWLSRSSVWNCLWHCCTTCRLPFGFDLGLAFHASKIGKHCRYCKHWRVHNIRHLWQVELLQGEWTHSTRGIGTGNLSCRSCR